MTYHDRRCHDDEHAGPCQVAIDSPMTGLALCYRDGWQDANGDPQWMAYDTAGRSLRVSEYEVRQYEAVVKQ